METLAICSIVKNESKNLALTLPNNIKYADEVIIVDTGSTDDTIKLAKEMGAKVFEFEWNDDFSAARNFSISKSNEDWILWLDADEYVDESSFKKIRELINTTLADVIMLPIYESQYGTTIESSFYFREKLFKNNIGAKFIKKINEQLVFPENANIKYEKYPFAKIFHWGLHLPEDDMVKKTKERIKVLKSFFQNNKDDFAVLYLIATKYSHLKDYNSALNSFLTVVDICKTKNSQIAVDFMHASLSNIAKIFMEQEKYVDVLPYADKAIEINPKYVEPYIYKCIALFNLGRNDEAMEISKKLLGFEKIVHPILLFNEDNFSSLIPLLYSRALIRKGLIEEAKKFISEKISNDPKNEVLKKINGLIKQAEKEKK